MICRRCPVCGGEWFSADTGPWDCAYCGEQLDRRHDVAMVYEKKGEKSNAGVKFRWN